MSVSPVPDPALRPLPGPAALPARPALLSWISAVEAPTIALILVCSALWMAATALHTHWLAWPVVALLLVLHSSLTHEVVHGHPTPNQGLNAALVFPAVGLFVPYERFRDMHLAHHQDAQLTDPYDDPESNYLDPAVWETLSWPMKALLRANNTLAGRILLGPAIGLTLFFASEIKAMLRDERMVQRAWALHLLGLVPVCAWLWWWGVPLLGYLAAAYFAMGVLKIRTFLEHRAHEAVRARSVVIEDRGPLAFLFLNNNLHAVHHCAPAVAWYRLPALYRERRERVLEMNGGYRYRSYGEVFLRYFWRRKDPVAHPLMSGQEPER